MSSPLLPGESHQGGRSVFRAPRSFSGDQGVPGPLWAHLLLPLVPGLIDRLRFPVMGVVLGTRCGWLASWRLRV